MTSLHLLAGVMQNLPWIAVLGVAAILIVAFVIGAIKGFRKISFGGLCWAVAGVSFILLYRLLYKKNPLISLLNNTRFEGGSGFAWSFLLAMGCILVSLTVFGILAFIRRPREVWVTKYEHDRYGFEYEIDDGSGKGEEKIMTGENPNVISRIFGGFLCMLNVGSVVAVIATVAILFINATGLSNTALGAMFDGRLGKLALQYSLTYAFDFITIGIILGFGYIGFRKGFIDSARAVTVRLGVIVAIIVCMAIPFVGRLGSISIFKLFIGKCVALVGKVITKASIASILGKVAAGVLMSVAAVVLVLILSFMLTKLSDAIEDADVLRIFDGILAVFLYLVIGLIVCIALWAIAYSVDHIGLLQTSKFFNESATISNEFFAFSEQYFKPLAQKILSKIKK